VTHWSSRLLAAELGLSHSTVARVWAEHDVKPWQTETFKFSTDPQLDARVRDVVGLYLDPPARAIVLCVDEKAQIRRWNAPNRSGRWRRAEWSGGPTTMSGTAPPRCLPPWRWPPGR
jgi:hypothetical protein